MVAFAETALGRMNIYDESNHSVLQKQAEKGGFSRGYTGRDYSKHPFGSMPFSTMPFKDIPRGEWGGKDGRIAECNAKKMFSLHHHIARKVPIKDQARTNYCWINSVTGAIDNARARHGLPTVDLSSASAGAPGKKYQNVGGWTGEAIGYWAQFGGVPISLWPNADINRKYFDSTRQVATHFNIGQWIELYQKKFNQIATCLLLGFDVVVGLAWWGHSVRYNALVEISHNVFGVVCVNSWGPDWENGGMTVLAEEKANADEANCVSTVLMDGWQHDLKRIADWSFSQAV